METICFRSHWVTWHGRYRKKLQLFCINIFMPSNLMTVPKSVSSDSVQGSGRWANHPPAANTGWTSVKSRLDPSEYLPNIQPETNFTLVVMSRLLQPSNGMTTMSVTQLKWWLVEALLWMKFRHDKWTDLRSNMKTWSEVQKTLTAVASHYVYQYPTHALHTHIQVIFTVFFCFFLQTWQYASRLSPTTGLIQPLNLESSNQRSEKLHFPMNSSISANLWQQASRVLSSWSIHWGANSFTVSHTVWHHVIDTSQVLLAHIMYINKFTRFLGDSPALTT